MEGYLDGRHQCLFDVIARRQRHQRYRPANQARDEPAWVLAERHVTTEQTFRKWRKRDSVQDRSHPPHTLHRLQTTLTTAQQAVAVALRKT